MTISVVVVRDPDCPEEEKRLRGFAVRGGSIDNNGGEDDSLSCRTDQKTVQASNARRVTVSRMRL